MILDLRKEKRRSGDAGNSRQKQQPSRVFSVLASIALVIQSGLLFLALFEPPLPYAITRTPEALDSERFLRTLGALAQSDIQSQTTFEVLTNGEKFYAAELNAIRSAQRSVNLEAYIFKKGEVARQFMEALAERARAGVHVNLVLDAVGSNGTTDGYVKPLREAGARVAWYHALRWHSWPRINNRTHRELLIVDGKVAFTGGAGVADHWLLTEEKNPRWRDTMVRLEGLAVANLQATFAENWLETSGEVLTGPDYFPFQPASGNSPVLVVRSSPTSGRSTNARVLVQTIVAAAKKHIYITTPYFLPDRSLRDELARAIKERRVEVRILVPGKGSDHTLTRRSSRRLYGDLLKAGASIYEYEPSMIHTKSLVADGVWSVFGSSNLDSRSFGLNDEVNVATLDGALAARLTQDFTADLAQSKPISYEEWAKRPFWERVHEWFGALLERQQ